MVTVEYIFAAGAGTTSDEDFCSTSSPCQNWRGDCDNDDECIQDHSCGDNNCIKYWNLAEPTADCCFPGKLIVIKAIYKGKIAVGIDLKPFRGKAGRRIRTT